MANYHIRVCAVGSGEDIDALLRVMLRNCCELEDDPDGLDAMPRRNDMVDTIHRLTERDSGNEEGFQYDMITPEPFGRSDAASSRFSVREESCGEWSVCFDYHSADAFQADDWLRLHMRSNMLQLTVQYACDDFAREKGCALIAGGKVMDNWACMAEVWFWLILQYTSGETPEGVVEQLTKVEDVMMQEDFDMPPEELLCACETNLRRIDEQMARPEELRSALDEARAQGDWGRIASLRVSIAESILWETERNPKWLACLEAARLAWNGRY